MDRFWDKVDKTGDCWEWLAGKTANGYGSFFFKGKQLRAHRMSWMLERGDIPKGMYILHSCDNAGCVNPNHLRVGTPKENMQDKVDRDRQWTKLNTSQVGRIRELYATGIYTMTELGEAFNVSYSTTRNIIRGIKWKNR